MDTSPRTPCTPADLHAHIREQAAALVRRVNEGRDLSPEQFTAKTDEVHRVLFDRLTDDLVAMGRSDLALKLVKVVPA
jgi:hypothetical protein